MESTALSASGHARKKNMDHILTRNSDFEELASRQDGDQRDDSAEKNTCHQARGLEFKPLDPHDKKGSTSAAVL